MNNCSEELKALKELIVAMDGLADEVKNRGRFATKIRFT